MTQFSIHPSHLFYSYLRKSCVLCWASASCSEEVLLFSDHSSVWSAFLTVIQKITLIYTYEPPHNKTNKMTCASSKDSDQPGHLPSLIRVLTVRMEKPWGLSYPMSTQRRLWLVWVDAQADLSLCWAHMPFCWFCHVVAHIYRKNLNNLDTQKFVVIILRFEQCSFTTE